MLLGPLTYDLLVSAVLPSADVDEVEQYLALRETAHKLLEFEVILVDAFAYKHITESSHVRIDAAHDACSIGNIVTLVVNVFLDGGGEIKSSPAATLFVFYKVLITKLGL
jgi:hypothetical protein